MNLHNFESGALRNRPIHVLSMDQIRSAAPSAFAAEPHHSRSERYAYIPTSRIIERLLDEGFRCTEAVQSRTRIADKRDFTKHMLKFTREGQQVARVGDSVPQLVLVNSHDGSSRYKLLAGLFRLVCSNGLMVSDGTFGEVSVPHTGDVVGRVIEGSYTVIEGAERAGEVAATWRAIELKPDERVAFARTAALLRWDGSEENPAPVAAERLLQTRRHADNGMDLWTTYNAVQENMVRGGQKGSLRDARGARRSVRAVKGIDGNVQLNRALWALTERMAALKAAA